MGFWKKKEAKSQIKTIIGYTNSKKNKTKNKNKNKTTTTTINDKAPGGDDAVSEYITTTNETLVNYLYVELLDLILILIVTE